jgi:hypothetical protein
MEEFEPEDFRMTSDPMAWAKAFVEVVRGNPALALDEGFVVGWFANFYSKGSDDNRQKMQTVMDGQNRELRAMSYYVSHHCHRNPMKTLHLQTPQEIELETMLTADRSMLTFVREHMVRLEGGEVEGTR